MYTIYKHTAPNGKVYIGATSLDVKDRFGRKGKRKQSYGYKWKYEDLERRENR